jgi:hypothetical protein
MITGSLDTTQTIFLDLPLGYYSHYHYLCLSEDEYILTCCGGTGDYEDHLLSPLGHGINMR